MSANPITKEEWMDWKSNKVTYEFLKRLSENREMLKEGLAEGQAGNIDEMIRVIGQCQGIKDSIDYAVWKFDVIDMSSKEDKD